MGRASEHRKEDDHAPEGTLQSRWLHHQTDSDNKEHQFSGACRPSYYFPGHARLRRYVGATSLHLIPAPTQEVSMSKRNTPMPCSCEGAGQRACTVPTSTPTTVIRISSTYLFYHMAREAQIPLPKPQISNGAFIPSPQGRRDFPRRFVKKVNDKDEGAGTMPSAPSSSSFTVTLCTVRRRFL